MATHLTIIQGTPFAVVVRINRKIGDTLSPYELTDGVIKLQAREHTASTRILLELSSPDNGITITDEDNGVFEINMTPEQTAALCWGKPHMQQRAVYQCEITKPGDTIRALSGLIYLDPEVVR